MSHDQATCWAVFGKQAAWVSCGVLSGSWKVPVGGAVAIGEEMALAS